ncbi:Zinc finger, PMZ-type [Sesbania bispinosa]|nr:Zinc finger, PMZ-type [Sesbania bispinosa]
MDNTVEFLYEELAKATDGFSMANIIGQGGLGMDENFYFSDTDVDENYTPSEGEVDEEGNENINGEQYEGLSDEEEDLGLSDVDLEDLGAINDTDSEGELFDLNKNIEGKRFHSDDNGKVKLERNGLFVDVYEFRAALKDYIIQECFDIGYIKNEKTRVTAICEAEGCPWRIHASTTPDVQAVSQVFPHAWHRCCAKHLFNNFKARYPHVMLRDYFWAAVFAPSEKQFKEAMEKMSKVDNNAAKYLMETPVNAWSRHAFDPASKSPHITNNMCESFNQWVNKLRDKPPIILLDEMRIKLMIRWQKRYEIGCTCIEKVLQKIAKELSVINIESRACIVYGAGRDQYEVNDRNNRHVVDLQGKTCGCTQWQISGLPCIHTAATIRYKRAKIEDYVDVYYNPIAFVRSYDTIIHPLPSVEDLLESDILAPPLRRLPGRPKKNRKRAKDEPAPSTLRKRLATVRCKNCQELGHNARGCQRAPIKAKRIPTTTAQGSTATSSQRMSQTNMSAQQKLKLKMMEKKSKKNGMQQNQQGSQQRA